MELNKFFQSKVFKKFIMALVIIIIVLISFGIGVSVGYHKARFSYAWGEYYDRNFGGPHHGIFGLPSGFEFMTTHGTFGTILSVSSSTLAINGRDGLEKTVLVSTSTIIKEGYAILQPSDLKVNNQVVVIGFPNGQGQIDARFIRVLK